MTSDSIDEIKKNKDPRLVVSDVESASEATANGLPAPEPGSHEKLAPPLHEDKFVPKPVVDEPRPRLKTRTQIGLFALFVLGSFATILNMYLYWPGFLVPYFNMAWGRTIICAIITWNLIGAILFCRTKVNKGDSQLVALYTVICAFCSPLIGFLILPILFWRAVSPKRPIALKDKLRGQLLLYFVFGAPATLGYSFVMVITALLTTFGVKP
jgi:hypothetical protein